MLEVMSLALEPGPSGLGLQLRVLESALKAQASEPPSALPHSPV
jgi:hypothetical protein